MKQKFSFLCSTALFSGTFLIRKLFNLSALIGTPHIVFVTPLLGCLVSAPSACGIFAVYTLLKICFGSLCVARGIPTFFSVLSWSVSTHSSRANKFFDFLVHVIIPVICMGLFITHPVGTDAAWYSLYWFIPIVAWSARVFFNTTSSLVFALQSTFIAHALGSVSWIFALPTTAEYWLGLIPLVAIERLTMASATALLYECGMIILKKNAPVLQKTSASVSA